MLFLTILAASLWWNDSVFLAYEVFAIFSVVVCGIGYIYFGRNIVRILFRSGNQGKKATTLPIRIISFVVNFIVLSFVGVIIYEARVLGGIISLTLCILFIGFGHTVTFFFLFFKVREKKRKKKDVQNRFAKEFGPNNNSNHSNMSNMSNVSNNSTTPPSSDQTSQV